MRAGGYQDSGDAGRPASGSPIVKPPSIVLSRFGLYYCRGTVLLLSGRWPYTRVRAITLTMWLGSKRGCIAINGESVILVFAVALSKDTEDDTSSDASRPARRDGLDVRNDGGDDGAFSSPCGGCNGICDRTPEGTEYTRRWI